MTEAESKEWFRVYGDAPFIPSTFPWGTTPQTMNQAYQAFEARYKAENPPTTHTVIYREGDGLP
jgi:hypothetical protein